jgi:hypothetical protein
MTALLPPHSRSRARKRRPRKRYSSAKGAKAMVVTA